MSGRCAKVAVPAEGYDERILRDAPQTGSAQTLLLVHYPPDTNLLPHSITHRIFGHQPHSNQKASGAARPSFSDATQAGTHFFHSCCCSA